MTVPLSKGHAGDHCFNVHRNGRGSFCHRSGIHTTKKRHNSIFKYIYIYIYIYIYVFGSFVGRRIPYI